MKFINLYEERLWCECIAYPDCTCKIPEIDETNWEYFRKFFIYLQGRNMDNQEQSHKARMQNYKIINRIRKYVEQSVKEKK
tara:strand:- start:958 stop:1200 length:243 start_codon:yes stop_codon:yes gene_type:complete